MYIIYSIVSLYFTRLIQGYQIGKANELLKSHSYSPLAYSLLQQTRLLVLVDICNGLIFVGIAVNCRPDHEERYTK